MLRGHLPAARQQLQDAAVGPTGQLIHHVFEIAVRVVSFELVPMHKPDGLCTPRIQIDDTLGREFGAVLGGAKQGFGAGVVVNDALFCKILGC